MGPTSKIVNFYLRSDFDMFFFFRFCMEIPAWIFQVDLTWSWFQNKNGAGVAQWVRSYKPITNTAWVLAQLCKLPKGCTSKRVNSVTQIGTFLFIRPPICLRLCYGMGVIVVVIIIFQSVSTILFHNNLSMANIFNI